MTYTHGHEEPVLRSHRWRTAENSCAYLLPHLRPDSTLLDVGCGPGSITADLATRVGRAVGVDSSPEAVAAARADHPGVDFRVADLFDLDGRYDVVHAHQVLQHVQDPVGALRKLGSLGGLVAVRDSDYPAFVWHPDDARLDRWRATYLAVTRRNGARADAGRRLLAWAAEAGLADATYSSSTWTFAAPTARRWWGDLWADRTVASSFAEQAVAYGIATPAELAEIAEGWRAWAAGGDSVFVVVHGELLARGYRSG
jgi:SAM-dependent methyltransferase